MLGKTLRKAAFTGDINVINQLHLEGSSLNEAGPESKKTALHRAAEAGHLNVVVYLLNHNAQVDCQDAHGNTPLNIAIQSDLPLSKKIDVIQCLIQGKASPLITNSNNHSAFMSLCSVRDNPELMNKPNLQESIRQIIREIKYFVAEKEKELGLPASIQPNGEVIFGDATTLLSDPKSYKIN